MARFRPEEPDKFRPWFNLGAAYGADNRPKEAVECYRRTIKLFPNASEGYVNLSAEDISMGNYREAVETLEVAMHLIPNDYRLHYNLGLSYYGRGETAASIEEFTKTIKLLPSYRPAYIWLGMSCAKLLQYKKALRYYDAALSLQPNDPELLQTIKHVQSMVGQSNDFP